MHVAIRTSAPTAPKSAAPGGSPADRPSCWTGPMARKSWTTIHPVGVCQVVPAPLVPGTYRRCWGRAYCRDRTGTSQPPGPAAPRRQLGESVPGQAQPFDGPVRGDQAALLAIRQGTHSRQSAGMCSLSVAFRSRDKDVWRGAVGPTVKPGHGHAIRPSRCSPTRIASRNRRSQRPGRRQDPLARRGQGGASSVPPPAPLPAMISS